MHGFLCLWIKGSCLGVQGLSFLVHLPAPWGRHLGKDMLVLALEARKLACIKMVKARGRGLATVVLATNPQYKSLG